MYAMEQDSSQNSSNGETSKSMKYKCKEEITITLKNDDNENAQSLPELQAFKAHEPWPKDVKLFQPYEVEQILLPDNANCLAVQAFLKMCGLDFQVEPRSNAEAMSPTGKVPFIKVGRFVVAELEGIVQFVNNKELSLLTEKLDAEMKADMRAYMSLVHNVLEIAELYICWCDNETYNDVTSVRNGSIYPWPLNHIQNRAKKSAVAKKLKVLNWYNKSMHEVFVEVENCCQALSDRLEGKTYFFGDHCELDALVFGHIYAILTTPLPACHNKLACIIQKYDVLVEHCQRIKMLYMSDNTNSVLLLGKKSDITEPDFEIVDQLDLSILEEYSNAKESTDEVKL